jgi:drug/metabolite transporter (DMT)-like permease
MRDQILKRKVNMNIETKNNDYWRWLGFLLAVFGAYVLGNAEVNSQWLGWSICTVSCLIWIFMGIKDRDIPRTLMEIMYFIIGLRAIVNWLNFS